MKTSRIIIGTLVATLLLSTSALAWNGGKRGNCPPERVGMQHESRLELMSVILDLSPEQQQKIAELSVSHRAHRAQMHKALNAARQDLRSIKPGADFDAAALKAKADAFAQLKAEMLVDRIEHRQQVFSLLTPEQQEKAAKLRAIKQNQGQGRHPHSMRQGHAQYHQRMINACR